MLTTVMAKLMYRPKVAAALLFLKTFTFTCDEFIIIVLE